MFAIDKTDIQRVAVSAIGAITLSAACVFGAVGPAKAAAPASVPAWQARVEHRIADVRDTASDRFAPATLRQAEVALHFTAEGDFAGASLARSSGNAVIDARAVKVASRIAYPQLPVAARGAARDVTLRLAFGDASSGAYVPADKGRVEVAARDSNIQIAAR